MAELRTSSVVVDGLNSPLIESGPEGVGEAVVYIHGSPGSCADFRELVAHTGEFARAIAIDLPGFGQADKPHPRDFEYSVPSIGVHLAKQLELLGVERAHLVGHDFGGGFAQFAASYSPARTASLAMVNSGLLRGYRWHAWARIWRTRGIGELTMAVTNKQGFDRAMRGLPQDFIDEMWGNFDRRTRRAVIALYRATNHREFTASIPMLRLMDWPSIVIWGASDPYIGPQWAERNLEAFPSAEVHVLEGAGHWPFIDRPEAFEAALFPFLRARIAAADESHELSASYR
ncbi:MAG: alpha/beta fold hydrolase [Solirubrobacterales bacterium]